MERGDLDTLQRYTPRSTRRTRLAIAATVWSAAGLGVLVAGLLWLLSTRSPRWIAMAPLAFCLGWIKGRFVLVPRAERNARRILASGESRCVGGAFSWSSWGIAALMVASGVALRHSPLPRPWLGVLYCAIGSALVTASVRNWRELLRFARGSGTVSHDA